MDHRVYQICVKGVLDRGWTEWFEGLAIRSTENGDTILEGPLPDPSALYGIFNKLSDLGLMLISANPLEPEDGEYSAL